MSADDAVPTVTSLSLLERIKGNDPEAWRRLVQLYGPLVYQWCRRARLQAEDSADVSQEVFRTVAGKIGSFRRERAGDTFRGWLWTITRFKIGDLLRRKEREPDAPGGSGAQEALQQLPEELPDDDQSAADSRSLVHRALEQLRPEFEERTWQFFWLVTVEGRAPKDVAAEQGVTPDAVRMAKSRVLRRLREELQELDAT